MFVSAGSRAGRNRRIVTANNLTDGAGRKSGWDFEIASPGIVRNLYGAASSTNPYGNDLRFSFMTGGTGQGSGVSSQNGVFVFPGNNGYRMYMTGLGNSNNTIGWGVASPSKSNWLVSTGFPGINLSGALGGGVDLYSAGGWFNINNDTYLYRDGAAQAWAIRKGDTTAGSLRIYGVSTNLTSNWNRLNISMSNSTGGATIATESDGSTATAGDLTLVPGSGLLNIGASGASRIKAAAFEQTQGTLTSVTNSTAWDVRAKQSATLTLSENSTLSLATNQVAGTTYCLIVKQDATGGRTLNLTAYKFPGGTQPTLSTAANAVDILTFVSDGTNMYGVAQKAFA